MERPGHFTKEDMWLQINMKRWSTSLAVREMRYHNEVSLHIRMAKKNFCFQFFPPLCFYVFPQ